MHRKIECFPYPGHFSWGFQLHSFCCVTASAVTRLEDLASNTMIGRHIYLSAALQCRAPLTIARVPSSCLWGVNSWRRSDQRQKSIGWVIWSTGKPARRPKR